MTEDMMIKEDTVIPEADEEGKETSQEDIADENETFLQMASVLSLAQI